MKKLVLLATVVFGLTTMNAQKNSILLGGNVGYSHTEDKFGETTKKYDNYEYSPYLGYQFSDRWTLAADASFRKADAGDSNTKNTRIGGFFRYTQPLSETFAVYANIGAGWQERKTKVNGIENDDKSDGYYIAFNPALFINFKNNFGLNFSIGGVEYSHMKRKSDSKKSSGVDVTFGNAFNIGISKNFSL